MKYLKCDTRFLKFCEKLEQEGGGGTKICFCWELELEQCKGVYNLEDLSS